MEEDILTAARRVMRLVSVNITHDGGLLTIDTIRANEELRRQIEIETRKRQFSKENVTGKTDEGMPY